VIFIKPNYSESVRVKNQSAISIFLTPSFHARFARVVNKIKKSRHPREENDGSKNFSYPHQAKNEMVRIKNEQSPLRENSTNAYQSQAGFLTRILPEESLPVRIEQWHKNPLDSQR